MSIRNLFSLSLVVVAACAAEDQTIEGPLTKVEAAALAKSDSANDYCAAFGWYGDGVCDEFCLDPDPDCVCTFSGPETDAACANNLDDDCDSLVDCDDIDCATSLSCASPPSCTPTLETNAECANGSDDDCDGVTDCDDFDCATSLSCIQPPPQP